MLSSIGRTTRAGLTLASACIGAGAGLSFGIGAGIVDSLRSERRRLHRADHARFFEVRLPRSEVSAFADTLCDAIESVDGVDEAIVLSGLGRVRVRCEDNVADEAVAEVIEAAEADWFEETPPFWRSRVPIPGDDDEESRLAIEVGLDVTSALAAVGFRAARLPIPALPIELASIAGLIESTPAWREQVERTLGRVPTDFGLQFLNALNYSLIQGLSGPVAALGHHALRRRAVRAQSRLWRAQAGDWKAARRPVAAPVPEDQRGALPDGPIEAYSRRASPASLGTFAFGAAMSGSLRDATSLLFGGTPKPARLGRDAFVSTLMHRFAKSGIVVTDPRSLSRLDRLREVVVESAMLRPVGLQIGDVEVLEPAREVEGRDRLAAMFDAERPRTTQRADGWRLAWRRERLELSHRDTPVLRAKIEPVAPPAVDALIRDLHSIPLALIVVDTNDDEIDLTFEPTERIRGDLAEIVAERQREGRGVMLIGAGECAAYPLADVSIGLTTDDESPWGAHIAAVGSLPEAERIVAAVSAARAASQQSVYAAAVEAGASLILATGGLRKSLVRRVMLAANITAMLAMANAVRLGHEIRLRPRAALLAQRPWHRMEVDEVLRDLHSRRDGLAEKEVRARPTPEAPGRASAIERFGSMLADEMTNPFAPILIASAGLSAMVGAIIDALLIGTVTMVDSFIGAWQHFSAEREIAALSQRERHDARVRREGEWRSVDAATLVTGDIIAVGSGDIVRADARLIEVDGLELDESSLTGESFPVNKQVEPVRAAAIAERRSMIYAGTSVAVGTGIGVVTAVGDDTESRRAATLGERKKRSGVNERLEYLTRLTTPISALAGAVIMLSGKLRGRPHAEVVGTGVSLAVAAVPEGLPLLSTLAQVAASKRLARRGILVRRPESIEALGRVDVLCADKTGTLTTGTLKLTFIGNGEHECDPAADEDEAVEILRLAMMATPMPDGDEPLPHPTDQAVVDAARGAGLEEHHEVRSSLQFKPDRGYHAALCKRNGRQRLIVKGAPEVVLPLCSRNLDEDMRDALVEKARDLAGRGLRVLAVAERPCRVQKRLADRHVEKLSFRGFVGLEDPVRDTAVQAVDYLRRAGVETLMMTGDHPETAQAIGRELGLDGERIVTGPQIDALDDDQLSEALDNVRIFARVSPAQKVRIVKALQADGRVVAMTGDGANDAPAIRLAEAGIAVGSGATPAARHAADLVITDESIDRIVEAIAEGRSLWRSVRDAVALLVGGNVGELVFALFGGVLEGRSPMNTRQLLLVNLLTDALPALAIATRAPTKLEPEQVLAEGPARSLGTALNRQILWRATVTGVVATGAWALARVFGPRTASTVGMLTVVGTQLAPAALLGGGNRRVLMVSLGSLVILFGVVQTPLVSRFFGCRPLGPITLAQAAGAITLGTAITVLAPDLFKRMDFDTARLVRTLPPPLADRLAPVLLDAEAVQETSGSV